MRRQYKASRYGADHQALRKQFEPLVNAGVITCARCTKPIAPFTPWHLDHLPNGDSAPSHPHCNMSARSNPTGTPYTVKV